MIETEEKYIVFLAHLKENSVCVDKGQIVELGEQVGNIGNSGNSTAPHLHINLFDQMKTPLKSKVLPFVFNEYEELDKNGKWSHKIMGTPKIKSIIRLK